MKATGPSTLRPTGFARRILTLLPAAVVLLLAPCVAYAGPAGAEDLAAVLVDNAAIRFAPKVRPERWVLQVTAAEGVVLRRELSGEATSELVVPRSGNEALPEGHYTYSLYAVFEGGARREVQAGGFVLGNGAVTLPTPGSAPPISLSEAFGAGLSAAGAAPAFDFVINDDLVVIGSTCIGFDCYNNVPFSFTTLALAENNLRIMFHDTSTVASYPRRDWELEANSSANGGGSHFAIIDCGDNGSVASCPLGNRVFLVEGGAPANALRVDNSGRVGIGTANPVLEVHVRSGDTPSLRLDQSGGPWPTQVWDVAGNETSFFIRDAIHGSTLPFRIRPSSPSNALVIDEDGVGVGLLSPAAQLDIDTKAAGRVGLQVNTDSSPSASAAVFAYDGDTQVTIMNNGVRGNALQTSAFDNGASFGTFIALSRNDNGATPAAGFVILSEKSGTNQRIWVDDSGNVRVNTANPTNANDTAGTVVGTQSSWHELKTDIRPWDGQGGALRAVVGLPLYSFRFLEDSQRGDKVNHGLVIYEQDRDAWWVMNAAPNQTPVLDQANLFGYLIGAIKELDAQVADRDRAIDELTGRIEALEAALERIAAGADGSR